MHAYNMEIKLLVDQFLKRTECRIPIKMHVETPIGIV
jgi:hypothetical protein